MNCSAGRELRCKEARLQLNARLPSASMELQASPVKVRLSHDKSYCFSIHSRM